MTLSELGALGELIGGVAAIERFVGFPGSQKFWSDRSDAYTPEFRKVVDSIRERPRAAAHQVDEVGR
jgi:hypothetical protein